MVLVTSGGTTVPMEVNTVHLLHATNAVMSHLYCLYLLCTDTLVIVIVLIAVSECLSWQEAGLDIHVGGWHW